ncbi:signal peptide peptidase SppA [Anaeromicropila populeti]|uniref:Protease-4 n=1 Tax=Anaeromicropila populeti TaxID=37658 RepID=A0A1I6I6L4_9FIRM|nr:signal peptide peptidase SppA [Anaeromicropila populeti]SFR62385.1 protease-4 [Anaeromicropila populeti]
MKTKQLLGIIVAGLVFVFVCVSSAITERFSTSFSESMNEILQSSSTSYNLPKNDYVGVVRISGTIQEDVSSNVFSQVEYDHQALLDYISELEDSESNQAILLVVDSPGGTVYASDEMYLKLMEYKQLTERPIYAYFESMACSGGYYISMAADEIYSNRNCTTGSIGVIMSMTNLKGLYDKLGIKEINITSGDNKAMGSAGEDLTDEQKDILQAYIDETYDTFTQIVATGRGMEIDKVKELADGRIYTAKQAEKNGLIDGIKQYSEMESYIYEKEGSHVEIFEPDLSGESIFNDLFAAVQLQKTKSDAQILTEYLEHKGNGVAMYYANFGN